MLHYNPRYVSSVLCSSSGGQIVLLQRLESSLPVNDRTVLRLRADCSFEQYYAHLQEDELYYYSIWYRHSL